MFFRGASVGALSLCGDNAVSSAWRTQSGQWLVIEQRWSRGVLKPVALFTDDLNKATLVNKLPIEALRKGIKLEPYPAAESRRVELAPQPMRSVVKQYHGCEVTATKVGAAWHPYPWRFKVKHKGKTHLYAGTPNQCATAASALRRGWWRAKWLDDGTYSKRYMDEFQLPGL